MRVGTSRNWGFIQHSNPIRSFLIVNLCIHILMEQDQNTNKGLDTEKLGMKGEWAYRIIDASYRVHTRLYKLHYAVIHTEGTIFTLMRNNMITSNSVIITAILGLIALYIQVANIKLSSEFYFTLFLVLTALLFIYGYQFYGARKVERELLKISSEVKGEYLETWPDYLWDEAAKWGTRILMIKEILNENENNHPDKQEKSYITIKKNFTRLLEYAIDNLKEIRTECEAGLSKKPKYSDYNKTIQICNEFIEMGENV